MAKKTALLTGFLILPLPLLAGTAGAPTNSPDLTHHWIGYLSLVIFAAAILMVTIEEFTQLRKSKPMLVSAGLIWLLIAWDAGNNGGAAQAESVVRGYILQYAELMLLLLVVMTYINAMHERGIFHALRDWIGQRRISYRHLFWVTGGFAFLLSPLLDNLSTALLMGAVVMTVGADNPRFVGLACINVVIAANAGGVFSPFGDITTLMAWQQQIQTPNGDLDFWAFFRLTLPALVNFLIPASLMHFAVPPGSLNGPERPLVMRRGALGIMLLFLASIATAVWFQSLLDLPGVIGMLTGLSYLQLFGFFLKVTHDKNEPPGFDGDSLGIPVFTENRAPFDIFARVARAEWDTLLFLYGIILSVGGLAYMGYLTLLSELMYGQWGELTANVSFGLAASALGSISTMSAVLAMSPEMSLGNWLLVTLATGLGGSLLSIGSAAGVALMSQAGNNYTFFKHLQWTPAILLGYLASVQLHLWLNAATL